MLARHTLHSMLIDSHCHLEGTKFDADRDEVIHRAYDVGIRYLLAIGNGEKPEEADCGIRLAKKYGPANLDDAAVCRVPMIYASVGVHPHESKLANDENLAQLQVWARNRRVIGWGEIGLDYWYDLSPRDVQRRVFVTQLEMAKAAKKPVIIHCRPSKDSWDAWDECLLLLAEHWASSGLGGILHCFAGNLVHAKKALAMGFMLSFAGNVTFAKADPIREAVKFVPIDRMLIETDSPYLAPVPHRGRRNEPAFVAEVARQIGELRNLPADEIGEHAAQNFLNFFDLQDGSTKNLGKSS